MISERDPSPDSRAEGAHDDALAFASESRSGTPTLLIRADASSAAGLGHAMRCIALAQAWQDAGGEARFLLTGSIPKLDQRLRAEGMGPLEPVGDVTESDDAQHTAQSARDLGAQWVVLDGYGFSAAHQEAVAETGARLLCIDDTAHLREYRADLLVNQNPYATAAMYADSARARGLLLGSRYALLRREFVTPPAAARDVSPDARRVLVSIGGSDPSGLSALFLRALIALSRERPVEVTLVVGPGNTRSAEIERIAEELPACRIVDSPDDMKSLMTWADLAISAAGSTLWEMCYLGLPAAIVAVAHNQQAAARFLIDKGIATGLGDPESLQEHHVAGVVARLLDDRALRQRQSDAGQQLIDGLGARRVVASMMRMGAGGSL